MNPIKKIQYSKPIFARNKDKEGKEWLSAYSNKESKAVISLAENGCNKIITGNPKINMRLGESKFGEEMVFELLRTDVEIKEAPKRTNYDSIEIYLPKEFGIEFLEKALEFFKRGRK